MSSMPIKLDNSIRKRVFIGLLTACIFLLGCAFVLAWFLVSKCGLLINQIVLVAAVAAAILMIVILGIGVLALVISIWSTKKITPLQNIMAAAINFLFPMALKIGKWVGIEEELIKNSYVQVSNQLVKTRINGRKIKEVLILAPHCLQWKDCPHKITIDVNNCKGCGRCLIADLKQLALEQQAELLVVTGGTFARKVIKEKRPGAVVAIACERDLTSGIQDIDMLPVLGVVNERPEGPCSNTRVDLLKVKEALSYFQQGGGD